MVSTYILERFQYFPIVRQKKLQTTVGGHNYFTKMAAIKNQLLKHPISLSYLI